MSPWAAAFIALSFLCLTLLAAWAFSYFQPQPLKNDVPEETASGSEIVKNVATKLRARARTWEKTSIGMLIPTFVLVFIGVVIFLTGDTLLKIFPDREVELRTELETLERKAAEETLKAAATRAKVAYLSQAIPLLQLVYNFAQNAIDISTTRVGDGRRRPELGVEMQLNFRKADAVLASIKDGMTISGFNPHEATQMNPLVQAEVHSRIWAGLATAFSERRIDLVACRELLKRVQEQGIKRLDDDSVQLSSEDIKALETFLTLHKVLRNEKREIDSLGASRELLAEENVKAEKALSDRRDTIKEELRELRDQRDKIRFMAFLPGLTVRVGAVILLLFLTGILMAGYRYTSRLAAFFHARADALQLVGLAINQNTIDAEDLKTFVELLAPDQVVPDDVKLPYESITEGLSKLALFNRPG